jgi:hypothetical protein
MADRAKNAENHFLTPQNAAHKKIYSFTTVELLMLSNEARRSDVSCKHGMDNFVAPNTSSALYILSVDETIQ